MEFIKKFIDVEYIVVDGVSNDNTLDIIKNFHKKGVIDKYISEVDNGIYDAMNKGIYLSKGNHIVFLNSDDMFTKNACEYFKNCVSNDYDACYSNIAIVDQYDISKVIRIYKPGNFNQKKFRYGWQVPHPGFIAKKS